jgi:hypothetical protein
LVWGALPRQIPTIAAVLVFGASFRKDCAMARDCERLYGKIITNEEMSISNLKEE